MKIDKKGILPSFWKVHILSKSVGEYVGRDLIFFIKTYVHTYICNVHTYVTYIHPPPPTDSHLCVEPSFGNFQVPPLDPPLTPNPLPPAPDILIIFA